MKEGWEYKTFEECIVKVPRQKQIKSKDYLSSGIYPVVSQEQDLISGYYNDESYVYKHRKPIVVFGDHTKNIKYIDFDFVIGADGTQILMTIDDIETKFFYYAIKSIKLDNLGYARHYKLLKKNLIGFPSIDEQRRIVSYLDSSFKLIDEIKNKALKSLTEAKALFQSALAEAMEPKEGWEEKTFGEICTYHKEQKRENGYKYIGMENIESGTGNLIGYGSTDNVLSSTFFFKKGEVLYGRLRPYLKKVYIAEFDGCCSTEIFPIKTNGVLPGLIKYWFLTDEITNKINDTSAGCRMPRGNMNEVLQFHLYIPSDKQSQKQIVSRLDKLSSKVLDIEEKYQKMVDECDALKQAMLRDVFE